MNNPLVYVLATRFKNKLLSIVKKAGTVNFYPDFSKIFTLLTNI